MKSRNNVTHLPVSEQLLRASDIGDQRWLPVIERIAASHAEARRSFNRWGYITCFLTVAAAASACIPAVPGIATATCIALAATALLKAAHVASGHFVASLADRSHGTQAVQISANTIRARTR